MNYQIKSNFQSSIKGRGPRRNLGPVTRLITGIFLAFFFIMLMLAPERLAQWSAGVLTPFWKFSSSIDTPRAPTDLSAETDLRVLALEQENIELKHLLGRDVEYASTTASTSIQVPKDSVLATVLRRPPYSPYDSLMIDIGTAEGVVPSDRVLAPGNVLIGKVTEVYTNTSKVELYSNPGNTYDILIGKNNITATATARGGGVFEVVLPRDSGVAVGDVVQIPSITTVTFATVTAIVAEPARAFSTVLFSSPVNINQLRWVVVEHAHQ